MPGIEQYLTDAHAATLVDVAACLDVCTGLREILIASDHRATRGDVARALDVEAGLARILSASGTVPRGQADSGPSASPIVHGGPVEKMLERLDPAERLTLRMRHSGRSFNLAALRLTCKDLAAELGNLVIAEHTSELERTLVRVQHRVHHHDLDRGADLAHALDVAHALVLSLKRLLARSRALAGELPPDEARSLGQDLARLLDRTMTRAILFTHDLASLRDDAIDPERRIVLGDVMDRVLGQAGELNPIRARLLAEQLDAVLVNAVDQAMSDDLGEPADDLDASIRPSSELSMALRNTPVNERAATLVWLRQVLDDVVGMDLRDADLTAVPLAGIRWSLSTRWPAGWEEYIRAHSVPAEDSDGIFVILEEPGD